MTRKRRHFTADYKHQVARMVVDDGLKVADVCRDQNLGETAVRRWTDQLKAERAGGQGEGQPLTAEYIYGKKQLREIDRRVRYLSKRLDNLTIVRDRPADPTRVFFGVWFEVEDEAGETARYRIVGPDEIDPSAGLISVDSPLARAALGKGVDDEFTVARPAGEATYAIVAVWQE